MEPTRQRKAQPIEVRHSSVNAKMYFICQCSFSACDKRMGKCAGISWCFFNRSKACSRTLRGRISRRRFPTASGPEEDRLLRRSTMVFNRWMINISVFDLCNGGINKKFSSFGQPKAFRDLLPVRAVEEMSARSDFRFRRLRRKPRLAAAKCGKRNKLSFRILRRKFPRREPALCYRSESGN